MNVWGAIELFEERYPKCHWDIDAGSWILQNKEPILRYNTDDTWRIYKTDIPCKDHIKTGVSNGNSIDVDFNTMCEHFDLKTNLGGLI